MTGKRFDVSKYITTSLDEIDKRLLTMSLSKERTTRRLDRVSIRSSTANCCEVHMKKVQDRLECALDDVMNEIATLWADRAHLREVQSVLEHTTQGTCDVCRKNRKDCEPLPGMNQDTVLICENCRDFPYGEFMDAMASVE